MRHIGRFLFFWGAIACVSCTADHGPVVVENPDIEAKIPAIKKVVRTKQTREEKKLVAELESDDPAVRFYAINGLKRMTGETFGYVYYEDELQRKPALEAWQHWLCEQTMASTQPTTKPAVLQEARR